MTANIILIEFKKFLFLVALKLEKDEEMLFRKEENGQMYFRCPFPSPLIIQKAWDLLILYSDNYK